MDTNQLTALIAAIAGLLLAINTLYQTLVARKDLKEIHANTNSALQHLTERANTAIDQRATAAELDARPKIIYPPEPPSRPGQHH